MAGPFRRDDEILGFLARRSFSGVGRGCRRNGKKAEAFSGHRYRAFVESVYRHFLHCSKLSAYLRFLRRSGTVPPTC